MSLLDKDLESLTTSSGYKFSVTKVDKLGSSKYTLVHIVQDVSGSVSGYSKQLEDTIKSIFKACSKSPRKDTLLLRITQFADDVREIHGFKLLNSINEDDYTGALQIGGNTALYDAADEAIQACSTYGKQLLSQDYMVNGVIYIVTDGESNVGNLKLADEVKKSLAIARRSENLESITVILVGVTQHNVSLNHYLQSFKDDADLTQYIALGVATPQKLAKLAEFVSQSISSTSTSLGSGAAAPVSQNTTF